MSPAHRIPPSDDSAPRRRADVVVPAAEGTPVRLAGHAAPQAVYDLPLPSRERGRRVAALLAAARAA
jgi:hypothetical protein